MPVTFHSPGALREFTSGRSKVEIEGSPATIADALSELWMLHPGVRDRIATEQGQIREHINIFVGDEHIRYTGGLMTPLSAGSQISIVPAISGGCEKSRCKSTTVWSFRSCPWFSLWLLAIRESSRPSAPSSGIRGMAVSSATALCIVIPGDPALTAFQAKRELSTCAPLACRGAEARRSAFPGAYRTSGLVNQN